MTKSLPPLKSFIHYDVNYIYKRAEIVKGCYHNEILNVWSGSRLCRQGKAIVPVNNFFLVPLEFIGIWNFWSDEV